MRKIIAIGESVLDTVLIDDKPVRTFVGGRIANAAASMGYTGIHTSMVSECCNDHVGDIIVNFMAKHGVETKSIDRFTDGSTEVSLIFQNNGKTDQINYGVYPADRFDVVWPRIDEDDIVIFGSFYSLDSNLRERLFEMVSYAAERKAIILYLPGFQHGLNCRITKVMPAILENLEVADIIIANNKDINDIFPGEDIEKAFHNHLEFYCHNLFHIAENYDTKIFSNSMNEVFKNTGNVTDNALGWQAGFAAGIMYGLIRYNITRALLPDTDADTWTAILKLAYRCAESAANSGSNTISKELAQELDNELSKALSEQ